MNVLRQDRSNDGLLVLRSPRLEMLGFRHAFSTAKGPGKVPFDLSQPGTSRLGIESEITAKALERFATEAFGPGRLGIATQVHGAVVVDADRAAGAEADAVIAEPTPSAETGSPWIAAVRTADCVPVLLACPRTGRVAAVHAGWRGLVADVLGAAIRSMSARGSRPEEIEAAIGPAIGVEGFEIGPEVADRLRETGLGSAVIERSPRPHADLHAAARIRIQDAGVRESSIDGLPISTEASADFFSHRRDAGLTGRHLAAIRPRFELEEGPGI